MPLTIICSPFQFRLYFISYRCHRYSGLWPTWHRCHLTAPCLVFCISCFLSMILFVVFTSILEENRANAMQSFAHSHWSNMSCWLLVFPTTYLKFLDVFCMDVGETVICFVNQSYSYFLVCLLIIKRSHHPTGSQKQTAVFLLFCFVPPITHSFSLKLHLLIKQQHVSALFQALWKVKVRFQRSEMGFGLQKAVQKGKQFCIPA